MPTFPAPGEMFGRYRIGRMLGHGGLGLLLGADDTPLGRPVAP